MLTILLGFSFVWNLVLAISWKSSNWINLFAKMLFIILTIAFGMYFLNAVGITTLNLS